MPLSPKRLPLRSALDAATLYDATGTKYAPAARARVAERDERGRFLPA